jgi:hypothetical protein
MILDSLAARHCRRTEIKNIDLSTVCFVVFFFCHAYKAQSSDYQPNEKNGHRWVVPISGRLVVQASGAKFKRRNAASSRRA